MSPNRSQTTLTFEALSSSIQYHHVPILILVSDNVSALERSKLRLKGILSVMSWQYNSRHDSLGQGETETETS